MGLYLLQAILNHISAVNNSAERVEVESVMDEQHAIEHPLNILVAEDNLVNQKVITRILERFGYVADLSTNGLEAVAAVQKKRYDLVLMDVHMPQMNGLEATAAILGSLPADTAPQIVAMTAATMTEECDQCLEAGMAGFIAKPVSIDALVNILKDASTERLRQPNY